MPISHWLPDRPGGHSQTNDSKWVLHFEPYWHGLEMQGFSNFSQNSPMKREEHWHWNDSSTAKQFPLFWHGDCEQGCWPQSRMPFVFKTQSCWFICNSISCLPIFSFFMQPLKPLSVPIFSYTLEINRKPLLVQERSYWMISV